MARFEAVIFDLDGTLLDTLEDLAHSMNRVLERHGFPIHPVESYRYFVGDGARVLAQRVLPEDFKDKDLFERILKNFLEDYSRNWAENTRPYPGIEDMLRAIQERGLKMAVLSNKPHDFTRLCVERFLGKWNFQKVMGERPGIPRKPDPTGAKRILDELDVSPQSCLYLGDTSIDMKTANAAYCFPVGCLWGFRDRKELEEAGAKRLIANPLDLLEII